MKLFESINEYLQYKSLDDGELRAKLREYDCLELLDSPEYDDYSHYNYTDNDYNYN